MLGHPVLHRRLSEGVLVALVAMACSFVVGFVLPAFQHPIGIAATAVVVGAVWVFRPQQRPGRYVAIIVLAVLAVALPMLISPSWFGRLLP